MNRNKPPAGDTDTDDDTFEWIGTGTDRVEDPPLLTGHAEYIDDVQLPNMAHAAVLRSPHAHARIKRIDTSEAEALDGVELVMTGAEASEQTGPLPSFASPPVEQYCIAKNRVRHVGETVAAVVAENRYIAEDAIDRIAVEYEPLPVVTDPEEAVESTSSEVLHPERDDEYDGNVVLDRTLTFGAPDENFDSADTVISREFDWPRVGAQPMETAGAVAEYNKGTGTFTIHSNTSSYNYLGWMLGDALHVPSNKVNVVPKMVGGSFGSKFFLHKVCLLTATLARASGRPVKFIEDRIDNFTNCDNHGCDRRYEAKLALNGDGTMTGLSIDVLDDYGAYFQLEVATHGNVMAQVTGPYQIESVEYDLTAVLTNKCQQGPYRGFGSEVGNFVLERLVDGAAEELGMSRRKIRRKNFIEPDQFPYKIPTGNIYDSGDYERVLETALGVSEYEQWNEKKEKAREKGRYIGVGLATCQERSVLSATELWVWNENPDFPATSSPESVEISIDQTGKATVILHSPSWGTSPETVATKIVAEELSIEPEDIEVTYADRDGGLDAFGPAGSRFTVMAAGAIEGATSTLKEKILTIAADVLEASEGDLALSNGDVHVQGAPERSVSISDIAIQAHAFALDLPEGVGTGLSADHTYDHPYATMPEADRSDLGVFFPIMGHMCHIPVVEVDIETGQVAFLDYTAVHDCGTVVNPNALAENIRGGTVQGIDTALYQEYKYTDDGQLLTDNFHDYPIPKVHDVPDEITVEHVETPSPWTEYGIKGGGEGGRMAAPAAVASAVEDALRPLGIEIDELPLTPQRLREKIRETKPE